MYCSESQASLMTLPAPCGLAISGVTSDGEYLYALQPDRKTVYRLDTCGRILCTYKLSHKYTSIHFCGNRRFFATAENDRRYIYVLNGCFHEVGMLEPTFDDESCNGINSCSCRYADRQTVIGGSGDCGDNNCMLTVATPSDCYAMTPNGRIVEKLSSAGRGLMYTAVCENNGILYEALECRNSDFCCIRATLLSSGAVKTKRLPSGTRVRSFFCCGGYLYAFFTKNAFHGYIAAVCSFPRGNCIVGDILELPEDGCECTSCRDESCHSFSSSSCASSCVSTSCGCGITSMQTELCDNQVGSESIGGGNACDVDELCRLYNCLRKLCGKGHHGNCNCNCGGHCRPTCGESHFCTETEYGGGCCDGGTLDCTCYKRCCCDENEISGGTQSCLPLPCSPDFPCPPCAKSLDEQTDNTNLKASYSCKA